ncbi:O-methyltransferase [Colletotrichum cuscutae]|uniref:O-methyltransferase n=1 Tax=Colletotrichum cuscutae TaxID=1209917 RepID=A0AAI9XMQ0_9PEZI|nr:O-methyltransferase [Colletotrichum cuscutae]
MAIGIAEQNEQITYLRSVLAILTTSTNDLIAELSSSSAGKAAVSNGAKTNPDVRIPKTPKAEEARKRAIAATTSLEAAILTPQWRHGHLAHSYYISRALHMVVEWEIPQLLAANGPMTLDALASKTGIADPSKLGFVMRTLCAHHICWYPYHRDIGRLVRTVVLTKCKKEVPTLAAAVELDFQSDNIFSETSHDVFANEEASTALATDERLATSVRFASFLFPTADVLAGLLKDPVLCASYEPRDSAFAKSIGKGMGQFEYLNAHPEWRDCFDFWLASLGEYLHGLTDVRGYPWETTLRNGAVIVDVGGGLGSSIQSLRTNLPHHKNDFVGIVQDQPGMIAHATAHCNKTDPQALTSGVVKLTPHDFFNENPVKGADVYWFRSVIVDWQDKDLTTMFTHIRNAMAPGKSRLLIGEYIPHPTCGDALLPDAPAPLLKNYGAFQSMGLIGGFVLTASPNGRQRTFQDLDRVVKAAGLKIVKVWICRGLGNVIECRLKEDRATGTNGSH